MANLSDGTPIIRNFVDYIFARATRGDAELLEGRDAILKATNLLAKDEPSQAVIYMQSVMARKAVVSRIRVAWKGLIMGRIDQLIESLRQERAEIHDEIRTMQAEAGLNGLSDASAEATVIEQIERLRFEMKDLEQRLAACDGGR